MIELCAQFMQPFRTIDRIKLRSVRRSKGNTLPERVRNDQNIGKQDCGIESESSNRLQCNFRCQFRIKTKIEEIVDLLPSARYSGKYRPACRISQIGGTVNCLPARTSIKGLVTDLPPVL